MTNKERSFLAKQGRLRSLLQSWTMTSQKKNVLHAKSSELASPESLKPSLLQKVTLWMEQISLLEHKERDIISKINDIEKTHKTLRKKKKLRRAEPVMEKDDYAERQKRKNRFWFWFFLLIIMMRRNQPLPKPQNG